MTIPLEIKAAAAGVTTSGLLLVLAFAWAGVLRNQGSPEKLSGNQVAEETKGRRFFVQTALIAMVGTPMEAKTRRAC